MIIKEYDLLEIYKRYNAHFGTIYPKEAISSSMVQQPIPNWDFISESDFEKSIHLSVLEDMKDENITFMELGAGFGMQSIDVFGAIKNAIVSTHVKTIRCIGIEAEPTHYKWLCDTFKMNGIDGLPIYGAISNKLKYCGFCVYGSPDTQYGGTLCGDLRPYEVPCFTIDYLFDRFEWAKINYIDMDVQGAEVDVLQGGIKTIESGKIDYIKIETHATEFNQQIRDLVGMYYDIVVDIMMGEDTVTIGGFSKPIYIPQNGIMLLRRRGL